MKPNWPLLLVCAWTAGGCVLPIPSTRVVAPSISGRVIHAHTGAPVDMAGIVVEEHKAASVITSRDGSFHTDQITGTRPYWIWWPFGGDPVKKIKLHVVRPGYAKHKEKIEWHPKTQPAISLVQPIALEPKSAEEAATELLKDAAR
jgi:hypothetical protein